MDLQNTIDQKIKEALLAKDQVSLRGLRAIKAALLLAKTEKGASEQLTEDAEIKVLQRLVKQRKESLDIYETQKRPDLAQIESEEIEVISQFLPKQLEREELEAIVREIIEKTGASNIKDLGKVMGPVNQKVAGRADGKLIAEIVKQQLS